MVRIMVQVAETKHSIFYSMMSLISSSEVSIEKVFTEAQFKKQTVVCVYAEMAKVPRNFTEVEDKQKVKY